MIIIAADGPAFARAAVAVAAPPASALARAAAGGAAAPRLPASPGGRAVVAGVGDVVASVPVVGVAAPAAVAYDPPADLIARAVGVTLEIAGGVGCGTRVGV